MEDLIETVSRLVIEIGVIKSENQFNMLQSRWVDHHYGNSVICSATSLNQIKSEQIDGHVAVLMLPRMTINSIIIN